MEKHDSPDLESGKPEGISHWKMLLDQGVVTREIVKHKYEGSGTKEDPYVVEWLQDDPRNPMRWPKAKKWVQCLSMAFATLTVSFCSSAFAGGIRQLMVEFHASQEIVTLGLSLFVFGFALGPLLWAPFSELYGRQVVFFGTFLAFVVFNAGTAGSKNIWTVIILRFLGGSFGSSPLTNAGGVVADLFNAKERGLAMSIFSCAPFMGPVLGPIVGGFLGQLEGWKWIQGVMAIFSGVIFLVAVIMVPETYPPVLLRKRAQTLTKMTGKVYVSRGDLDQGTISVGEAFSAGLKRPWILLFREPIVLLLSLYMAIIYGTLYMLFGAYPIVYQEGRHWSQGIGGLPFIGVAIGMIFALLYQIFFDNKRYLRCVEASPTGFAAPEDRLPTAMVGGAALPVGLFWFAWTNYSSLPWAASVAAGIPFGFGMVLVFLSVMNYLIDAYTIFAASVLAGNGILRSLFGAAFPLFTVQMYHGLGVHWASTIPAFLALICLPFPFLLYKYGHAIRVKCKYAAQADAFMQKLRGQGASPSAESERESEDSHASTIESEEDREQEAADFSFKDEEHEDQPRFEEMKTEQENDIKKVRTNRSGISAYSGKTMRTNKNVKPVTYFDNPYDIDRVNTRDTFPGDTRSRASSLSRTTSRISNN